MTPNSPTRLSDMIFFVSDRRIGAIRPDGSGECYPEFNVPRQASWYPEL